jgi:hypothetical protein
MKRRINKYSFKNLTKGDNVVFRIRNLWYRVISSEKPFAVETAGVTSHYSDSITIPGSVIYKGRRYSVTTIGEDSFRDYTNLRSIKIPDSVTTIYQAFYGCENLSLIDFADSITKITGNAFVFTKWYRNQPDGAIYIGKVLYKHKGYCPENKSLKIKDGTVSICDMAFYDCHLDFVEISESIKDLGDAFYHSFIKSIKLHDSITNIGFFFCSELSSIKIPRSVKNIKSHAFACCRNLTSIEMPYSLQSIEDSAFSTCTGLTTVEIPNFVQKIGCGIFFNCSNLVSIKLSKSITRIEDYTFAGCTSLKSIELHNAITSIGKYAFSGCSSLVSIKLPASLTKIEDWAFENCSSLTSIKIPNSVKKTGAAVFDGCTNLK